jgi:hypothetical protein
MLVYHIFAEMDSGQFASVMLSRAGAVALGLFMLLGAVQLRRYGKEIDVAGAAQAKAGLSLGAFWLGVSLIIPLLWSIALQQRVHFFSPRFLLYAMPCLCVLGAGCALPLCAFKPARMHTPLWKLINIAFPSGALAAVIVINLLGDYAFMQAPIDPVTDYRPLFTAIRPYVKPNDAALGTYIWMEGMANSYMPESRSRLTWYVDSYSPSSVDPSLAPVKAQHQRVWSFNFNRAPDAPSTLSVRWLRLHSAFANRFYAGNLIALLFCSPRDTHTSPSRAGMQSVVFDQRIRLNYSPITGTLAPGDVTSMQLIWTALQQLSDDTTIFVHVTAPSGHLVAQNDGDAVNGLAPGFTWKPGKPVIDQRAVLIQDISAPGPYTVRVGLYHRGNGKRLLTTSGADSVSVGVIQSN